MPKSMTGYGRASCREGGRRLDLEIRSVNSRFFELQLRCPRLLQVFENDWRARINRRITRGKLELRVSYTDEAGDDFSVRLDPSKAKAYAAAYCELAELLGEEDNSALAYVSRQSDVFVLEEEMADEEGFKALAMRAVEEALDDFESMRRREGEHLAEDLLRRLEALEEKRSLLEKRAPLVPQLYRERLLRRIEELLGETKEEYYSGQRVAAETAIFADKADVREELTRLASHFKQFRRILAEEDVVGKKLDFLIQEMNRETNTVGSKCNDLDMTKIVVDMKSQIEQLREQIQNLE